MAVVYHTHELCHLKSQEYHDKKCRKIINIIPQENFMIIMNFVVLTVKEVQVQSVTKVVLLNFRHHSIRLIVMSMTSFQKLLAFRQNIITRMAFVWEFKIKVKSQNSSNKVAKHQLEKHNLNYKSKRSSKVPT